MRFRMYGRAARSWAILLSLSIWTTTLNGAEVNIDAGTRYQTIEGFGFYPNSKGWTSQNGPFPVDVDLDSIGFYDTLISDLGATMIRTEPPPAFQADSGVWNYAALQGEYGWFNRCRKLLAAAERHDEPLHFMCQVWGPPGWMKLSGEAMGLVADVPDYNTTDCRLKDGYDDELATHLVTFMRTMRDSAGVEHYALSIQNETIYQWPWVSCVYNPERYVSVLKVVADSFAQSEFDMRFVGVELMANVFPNEFTTTIRNDPVALSHMHAWAVHGYSDGIGTDTSSYATLSADDKPIWMTSTGGDGYGTGLNDWDGAMVLARNLLTFLRDARGTAWTWWGLLNTAANEPEAEYDLMIRDKPTAKYYVSKHFYRYVRPGARQIASTSDDTQVRVVAFRHEAAGCHTIVLINSGESATTATVGGLTGLASFERITSTGERKCVTDTVAASGAIELPAKSVTTLVAGAYRGAGTHVTPRRHGRNGCVTMNSPPSSTHRVRLYTLGGRLVGEYASLSGAWATHTVAPGVYQVVQQDIRGHEIGVRSLVRIGGIR